MSALFQRGPAEEIPRFHLNLDRVTIDHRSIDSAICCLQSFVRDLLFTQRNFFTDNRLSMLLSAINVAGSVCEDSVYDPWVVISPEGYAAVVADLKRAYDVVVARRKDARDASERWFGVTSVESSVVGESSDQQAVSISNVVEVGLVEYLPQSVSSVPVPSTSFGIKSLGKGKQRRVRRPPNLQSSVVSNFTMSRWSCPRDVEFTSMTPVLQLLCEMKIKLFPRAVVVVVVVQHQFFSQVPDNFTYHCIWNYI